jgi:predicted nucleic acid-binding protein
MRFLLDTNVVSEWSKPRPAIGVVEWLAAIDEDLVFLSVMSLVELRYGVDRLADGAKRRRLATWLEEELVVRFEDRLLDVSPAVAITCGSLIARRERAGQRIGIVDGLIAATAQVFSLTLVTRNTADFLGAGIQLLNPWDEE